MLERIKRRGFLKMALGGAAAVALGEMGFGQEAEAAACDYYSYVCSAQYGGSCGGMCQQYCRNERYRSCPMCDDIRNGTCPTPTPQPTPDPCAFYNGNCHESRGGVCGAKCNWACTYYPTACAICQDRPC